MSSSDPHFYDWAVLVNPACGLPLSTQTRDDAISAATTRANGRAALILLVLCIVLACLYIYRHTIRTHPLFTCLPPSVGAYFDETRIQRRQRLWTLRIGVAIVSIYLVYIGYRRWVAGRYWDVCHLTLQRLRERGFSDKDAMNYVQMDHHSMRQAESRITAAHIQSRNATTHVAALGVGAALAGVGGVGRGIGSVLGGNDANFGGN